MRDLRNDQITRNVTAADGAQPLGAGNPGIRARALRLEDRITWNGDVGFWKSVRISNGERRYHLAARESDGQIRLFFGVSPENLDERWKAVIPATSAATREMTEAPIPGLGNSGASGSDRRIAQAGSIVVLDDDHVLVEPDRNAPSPRTLLCALEIWLLHVLLNPVRQGNANRVPEHQFLGLLVQVVSRRLILLDVRLLDQRVELCGIRARLRSPWSRRCHPS